MHGFLLFLGAGLVLVGMTLARAGQPGEIATCGCGFWWRVSKRGRWYAISKRRAFRALMPGLMRELGYLEVSGHWPAN